MIGASATDIRQTLTVTLESTLDLPCLINKESTIREWMSDPRSAAVLGPVFNQIQSNNKELFGGEEENGDVGMDVMDMLADMPLVSVLMFQQGSLTMPADEMVDGLLMQVHSKVAQM